MSKVYKEQLRSEMNADRKKLGKPSIEDDDAVPTQKDRKCFLAIFGKGIGFGGSAAKDRLGQKNLNYALYTA